jgi:dipeptidyl aminopeptidase/acylaminoacyl peptidase
MPIGLRASFAAALIMLLPPAHAAITPEQALDYRRISDLHLSPDGSKLTYIVRTYRQDYASHLWLMDVASGEAREITPTGKSERLAQWSPDGRTLAFLSNRDDKTQICLLAADGSVEKLTAQKNGVSAFRWSPDGRRIAFLGADDAAPPGNAGPQVADDPRSLDRLWLTDIATKTVRALGAAGYRIDDFQWQDSLHLLLDATATPRIDVYTNAVYRISTDDGSPEAIAHPPRPFTGLLASPDGRTIVVRAPGAGGPVERDLYMGVIGAGDLHDLSNPPDRAIVELRWHRPQDIWARIVDGFHDRLVRFSPGAAPSRVELPLSVESFDVGPDGAIAYAGGDFDHLAEIYLRTPDGRTRQLTHLQQGWQEMPLASTTLFHTRSFDSTDIEAALMKPRTPRPHEGWPLVLIVHGGPSSSFVAGYGWETAWGQMLVSHGYEVLLVNPRGSNGYSEDFVKANRADLGGGDYKDLMAVLDAVLARGETDPQRLGIGGWSYGGEMAAWAITQSGRFKAAVAGAPVFNQAAEFETEREPAADQWMFRATPWEHPEVFAHSSPAAFIRNAHTPTLILAGADDRSNPVGQSIGLYRALKHFNVETQLVLYPGEGHSPVRWSTNLDMFERILGWYDRHLGKVGS